jgi:hypothetical protein
MDANLEKPCPALVGSDSVPTRGRTPKRRALFLSHIAP